MEINLDTLPRTMRGLPRDHRGYPVPWFVAWIGGKPEFRAMDRTARRRAIQEKRCWVCGSRLGKDMCFVAGPMCGINRTSAEPPSHIECGRWSAQNCPFLANPHMVRREDEAINNQNLRDQAPGIALTRNPGVAMLWITRSYEIFPDGRGQVLIQMGKPESVEWWCEGKAATKEQVADAIDSGLPALEAMARQEFGGLEALNRSIRSFQKLLPA